MKRCRRCKVSKPLSEYHKHGTYEDGRNAVCKVCLSKAHKIMGKK